MSVRSLGRITTATDGGLGAQQAAFLPQDGACAEMKSAICPLKPCNSISGHPTHSGRGAEKCVTLLITAFQVLVKFCASVSKG